MTDDASSVINTPKGSSPASEPASRPIESDPGRSTAPRRNRDRPDQSLPHAAGCADDDERHVIGMHRRSPKIEGKRVGDFIAADEADTTQKKTATLPVTASIKLFARQLKGRACDHAALQTFQVSICRFRFSSSSNNARSAVTISSILRTACRTVV
jgi:hypothetical protein